MRAFMFLEDGKWKEANEYCEKVLDLDPECAKAYLGKLMAGLKITKQDDLAKCSTPFEDNDNYKKAVRFSDAEIKNELIYLLANSYTTDKKSVESYRKAAEKFKSISGYKDADEKVQICIEMIQQIPYDLAVEYMNRCSTEADYIQAAEKFSLLAGYKDADQKSKECVNKVENLKIARETALAKFKSIIINLAPFQRLISTREDHTVGLINNGTVVVVVGHNEFGRCNVKPWRNIVAISVGTGHTVGLKKDNTVVAVGNNGFGQCNVSLWRNIVAIFAGHLLKIMIITKRRFVLGIKLLLMSLNRI